MGEVYTEITIRNLADVYKGVPAVRAASVRACVDTGAWTLVICEEIQKQLGLGVQDTDFVTLADGKERECSVTDAVEVGWKNRRMTCNPVVLPGAKEILLGAIPLEHLDLAVHPRSGEVVGAHGDKVVHRVRALVEEFRGCHKGRFL
jgi:clan AA aspartic protease